MRISDWSSDVCSSDLVGDHRRALDAAIHVGEAERVERAAPIGALEIVDQRRGGHCRQRGGKVARGQLDAAAMDELAVDIDAVDLLEIGRASCRERVCQYV